MTWQTTLKHSLFFTLTALAAQQAAASGYHFGTQSVSAQSTANASAAEAADPSTVFYNGAGLTKLDGTQATVNLNLVVPNVKYSNAQAFYPDIKSSIPAKQDTLKGGEITQAPDTGKAGETSGKITKPVVVPHLYAAHKVNDRLAVGLGAYVPFGSGTDYDRDSVLRYNMNALGLQTMAIQPTVAFKLNEQHSFAVGLVAQHTKANLRQYANFGGFIERGANSALEAVRNEHGFSTNNLAERVLKTVIADGKTIPALEQAAATFSQQLAEAKKAGRAEDVQQLTQQLLQTEQKAFALKSYALRLKNGLKNANGAADGYAEVKGKDWGLGYTLSWLWDVSDSVRVGANFRSKVKHTLEGHNEWKLEEGLFKGADGKLLEAVVRKNGYAAKEDASVKIVTPESLSLHGMWKVNPQWNVFGDATWTRHSRFNQANLMLGGNKLVSGPKAVNYSNETVLTPKWRNTWKVAAGASYQYTPALQLRGGLAYDRSPVKNADLRMTTLPDNDRVWLSLGAKYDISPKHSVNAAYSHLFIKKAKANVNGYCGGDNPTAVACVSSKTKGSADYKSRADIFGVQYTYKF